MGITYYVSAADGNNNNPGTQPGQSLRTIQAAINKAQAGDTIYVRNGVYGERLHIQKAGTADAPIVLAAHQGEQPVIDGANLNIPEDAALVVVQQSQEVTLSGLTIRNAGGRGILVSRSSRIVVRGCAVETCYAGGVHVFQSDTVLIEQCRIHDCARRFLAHGPARLNVALLVKYAKDVIIQENQVYENSDEGISVSVGSRKVLVRKNVCYDNRNGQIGITSAVDVVVDSNLCYHTGRKKYLTLNDQRGPGITKHDLRRYQTRGAWHTRNVKITNNFVIGCGIGFRTWRTGGRLTGFQLAHNTIVNSTEQAVRIGLRDASQRSFIENNLIVSTNGGDMALVPGGEGIVWRHNLWSAFPGENVYNPSSDVVELDAGLVNVNAPVGAGAVTAEPYKLASASVAIDRGIPGKEGTPTDFWGTPRDGKPDIGASEFPGEAGDEPEPPPTLPPSGARITSGLIALYEFKEGKGRDIRDTSGIGQALNLRVKDEARVAWTSNGLQIKEPVLITSERPAGKVIDACRPAQEITVEAWIQPANLTQDGPARIISISSSKTARNFTLGQGMHGNQPTDLFMARLRTTKTSTNGLPAVVTPAGSATLSLTHVVYTRKKDNSATLYVNGQDRGVLAIEGKFDNWDGRMPLLLANELSEDRPWLGLFNLVAIYSRALSAAEVLHNYEAGFKTDNPVTAEFSILPGDDYGVAPHVVEFDSSESSALAGIASYFWEFGDGQTSNRASPAYTYNTPGVYTVSLTVTDKNGVSDKVTKERLITVVDSPLPPLPADYARFVLVDVATARVLGFGIQYPDLRCSVMWNEEPFHMLVYTDADDVLRGYTAGNTVEIIWVDELEEE